MNFRPRKIAVLGASPKKERYSNQLIRRLLSSGHQVFPVNPAFSTIEGLPVYKRVEDLPFGLDVLTIYMNASRSASLADSIAATKIPKVVFNPGAENPDLEKRLKAQGTEAIEACSIILLDLNQL